MYKEIRHNKRLHTENLAYGQFSGEPSRYTNKHHRPQRQHNLNITLSYLLILGFILPIVTPFQAFAADRKELANAYLQGAKKLYAFEENLMEELGETRSKHMTTSEMEGDLLSHTLMSDVVELLYKAIAEDESNIEANHMLGKIYYLRKDLEDTIDSGAVRAAHKFLKKVDEICSNTKTNECGNLIIENSKMLKAIEKALPFTKDEDPAEG